ncbi:hypothetical protein [Paenibacillus lentus]|uniref:Phage tail tape measure protein n=1 Tax=Paenibacillus lentus TaxID=1338368 RepID=A0A3Q8SE91_9BACL|nr:hypothetical protein [Paenibacillus lentus]AZK48701.1 hypothetical protein EIM92_23035 [Paenibacillus lentus]
MATVASTLKMFDAMSRPLKNITSSMNMMISTMQRMQSVTERNTAIDKQLAAAKSKIVSAEAEIRKSIEQSTREQERFNQSMRRGVDSSNGLLRSVKGMAAAYLSLSGAKQLFGSTVGGAMNQQQMTDAFAARAGNQDLGQAIYGEATKMALKYGQDVNAALKGTMSFMSNTMDPKQLGELNLLTMRLSKLNPAEGLEGAAFSLKELMSGDYTSIAERFNMSRTLLKDSEARLAGMDGNITGFIAGMNKLLDQQNMTQEAFEKMLDSPAAKWQSIMNTFKFNLANAGNSALQSLVPTIERINQAFQSGQMQPYFDMLAVGIQKAIEGLTWLFDASLAVYNFFSTNWPYIAPIVYGVVGAFVVMKSVVMMNAIAQGAAAAATTVQTLAMFAQIAVTQGLKVAWAGLNAVMKANVIFLVVTAVIGLITWLIHLWNTNDKFAVALYKAWNGILNFFDTIPAYFWQLVEWMMKPFEWWAGSIGKIYDAVINGIISGINAVLELINKVTGSSYEIQAKFNMEDVAGKIAEFAGAQKDAAYAMAGIKAQERAQKETAFLNDRANKRAQDQIAKQANMANSLGAFGGAGMLPGEGIKNIDKVNKIGKIEDKVDISSEDLKTMRELAEMKSIQNYVTLTPTVSVEGGMHVRQESDIDEIAARLASRLEEEIASGGSRLIYE